MYNVQNNIFLLKNSFPWRYMHIHVCQNSKVKTKPKKGGGEGKCLGEREEGIELCLLQNGGWAFWFGRHGKDFILSLRGGGDF